MAVSRDVGSIPGSGRFPGGGQSNPLQYCMEDPMDRGACRAIVYRVTRNWTRLKRLSTVSRIEKELTCLHRRQCVSWICLEKTLVDAAEVASCVDHSVIVQNSPWMEGVWVIFTLVKVPLGKLVEGSPSPLLFLPLSCLGSFFQYNHA